MEPAKPVFFPELETKLKKIEEFKLIYEQKEYTISILRNISILEKLYFQIKQSPSLNQKIFHENSYTLEDLKNINKYFRIFDNINEIFPMIKEIFEDKNASLNIEENKMFLILKINKIGKGEELISLEMKENSLPLEDICENLWDEIKILKNKVIEQENEIKLLKEKKCEECNNLHKEIILLKNENEKRDKIINELINWKKSKKEKKKTEKKVINKNIENKINNKFITPKNGILSINKIDSKIVDGMPEINFIYEQLKKKEYFKYKNISFELIFRATRDGYLAKNLHEKVDGIDNTIIIIKTSKGMKFGGYISYFWSSDDQWVSDDEECFVFSISLKKIYYPVKGNIKYYFYKDYGPNFSVFGIENNLFEKTSINTQTAKHANCFFSGFTTDYELNGGEKEFQVKELEIFEIISS